MYVALELMTTAVLVTEESLVLIVTFLILMTVCCKCNLAKTNSKNQDGNIKQDSEIFGWNLLE